MGAAGGRRRSEIFEHVKRFSASATMLPHRRSAWRATRCLGPAVLAGSRQKGHSALDSKGLAHRRPRRPPPVLVSTPLRRFVGIAIGIVTLTLPATLSAEGTAQGSTYVPSAHDLARVSGSGSYLAARHAGTQRD